MSWILENDIIWNACCTSARRT